MGALDRAARGALDQTSLTDPWQATTKRLARSKRMEKWSGNTREIDIGGYGREAKQEGIQKKEASGIAERFLCSNQHIKAKGLGKPNREAMDGDLKWGSGGGASIASETFFPTEPPMCAVGPGLHILWLKTLSSDMLSWAKGEQNGLRAKQMDPSSPYLTPLPICPKDWVRKCRLIRRGFIGCRLIRREGSGRAWSENSTHPSRLDGRGTVFLTLCTQRARAAMA